MSKDKLIEKLKERFKVEDKEWEEIYSDSKLALIDKDETDILHCTTMAQYNYYNKYKW